MLNLRTDMEGGCSERAAVAACCFAQPDRKWRPRSFRKRYCAAAAAGRRQQEEKDGLYGDGFCL